MKKEYPVDEYVDKFHEDIRDRRISAEVLDSLLTDGFLDVNTRSPKGNGLLLTAVLFSRKDLVEVLLKHNADTEAPGTLPLIRSTGLGNSVILRLLLEKGADPNAKNTLSNGQTALMFIANSRYKGPKPLEQAQCLLEFGAKANLKDTEGKTALDMAEENKFDDLCVLLKPYLKKEQDQLLKQKQAQQAIKNQQKLSDHISGHATPQPRRRPKP